MDSGFAKGLGEFILFLVIIVATIVGIGGLLIGRVIYKENYIESKALIYPEVKLTTDGKKVDTLYIYHKPE